MISISKNMFTKKKKNQIKFPLKVIFGFKHLRLSYSDLKTLNKNINFVFRYCAGI